MVGVPSALHLAAGLLAVAAATGLSFAIFAGQLAPDRSPLRLVGVAGGVAYALSHAMSGALVGPPAFSTWLAAAGLTGLAIGAGPFRRGDAAPLLIPISPAIPSYAAAAAAALAAIRIMGTGRSAIAASGGLLLLASAHGLSPTQPVIAEWLTVAGSVAIGAWLWGTSTRRILTRLLAAFVTALLALSILLSVVLSTVGDAQLTNDELDRLDRLTQGIVADVQTWPGEAINTAAAVAIAPDPLLTPRDEDDAATLYRVGFSNQDFFLVLDATGSRVTAHPADLSASLEFSLSGDGQMVALRSGGAEQSQTGGLLSSSGRLVAFGAVGLRPARLRPEDPPAGVLVTGRLVDEVYAEQESAALDVGIAVTIGGLPAITSSGVGVDGAAVTEALDGSDRGRLTLEDMTLFAATADVVDNATGIVVGRVIATSSPGVIANLERDQAQRLFIVSLLGGLIAVAIAAGVVRRTVRPIRDLTQVASAIEAGDLSGRAGNDSPDEVGVLGRTFDSMVASLASQQSGLTDAARTEARLRGRLESLTASMDDGLIAVDGEGMVIEFNPAAQRMTGLQTDAVLGAPLAAAVPDLAREDPRATTTGVVRLHSTRPDGAGPAVAATAAPVRSAEGEILGRVFVLRDISRENQIERMKTEFLANVSHELRTPITPIKGYANVLARRDVGLDATRRFASEILSSAVRLERIVGMIVDFAALDSGRVVLDLRPTQLDAVLIPALAHCRESHEGREVRNAWDEDLPPVLADPAYLRRVVDELLTNAVKFSPDGGAVDVTATVEGLNVRLGVVDRGIGIAQDRASELFSDFLQVDGTETRQFGGLGLGLALVSRILGLMGATTEVESSPGTGTTVSVLLPVGPQEDTP